MKVILAPDPTPIVKIIGTRTARGLHTPKLLLIGARPASTNGWPSTRAALTRRQTGHLTARQISEGNIGVIVNGFNTPSNSVNTIFSTSLATTLLQFYPRTTPCVTY